MAVEVIMPKVDMDQETGTIQEWIKKDGDRVEEGETILVIETDKVAVDVGSPDSGILGGISATAGEVVPIGTVIAYVLAEGEQLPPREIPDTQVAISSSPTKDIKYDDHPATPVAKKMAAAHGLDLAAISTSGGRSRITKEDVQRALGDGSTGVSHGKVYAVPAARRLAHENQVDLSDLSGSGPGGRIQSADVQSTLDRQDQVSISEDRLISKAERIPLTGIRRTIADRMTSSYQSIPHIRFTARVDMRAFNESRDAFNSLAETRDDERISATALMVKLLAGVLEDHPMLNSSLINKSIYLHKEINIGVAVALEQGLIVPVLHRANQMGLAELAASVNDLAHRAKAGELSPTEVKNGTFTISNLGPFGIEQFDAIINPPQAAILAVGATQLEAVPAEDGSIRPRPMLRMTLSADHRIVDGAVAARFMADLKATFEGPIRIPY